MSGAWLKDRPGTRAWREMVEEATRCTLRLTGDREARCFQDGREPSNWVRLAMLSLCEGASLAFRCLTTGPMMVVGGRA